MMQNINTYISNITLVYSALDQSGYTATKPTDTPTTADALTAFTPTWQQYWQDLLVDDNNNVGFGDGTMEGMLNALYGTQSVIQLNIPKLPTLTAHAPTMPDAPSQPNLGQYPALPPKPADESTQAPAAPVLAAYKTGQDYSVAVGDDVTLQAPDMETGSTAAVHTGVEAEVPTPPKTDEPKTPGNPDNPDTPSTTADQKTPAKSSTPEIAGPSQPASNSNQVTPAQQSSRVLPDTGDNKASSLKALGSLILLMATITLFGLRKKGYKGIHLKTKD